MKRRVKVIYASGHLRSISVASVSLQIDCVACRSCPSIPIRGEGVNLSLRVDTFDADSVVKGIEDHRHDGILYTTKISQSERERRVYDALMRINVGSKAFINDTVYIVTAVSTLWGKAAVRPFINHAIDFRSDITWVPVENVAKALIYP